MLRTRRSRAHARGATLIEVLVALFVLSVGLLGVAAMQQVGLRSSHTAHVRSQATALAYDIADRMRANRAAALAGTYDTQYDDALDPGDDCLGTTAADRAACDLTQWKAALRLALPGGEGQVELQPPGPAGTRIVRIWLRWDDERGGVPSIEFRTDTQL